jgi:7,8-dihydropterin-6-yl-methyl-4-(beta-D-ribofuranosyl)aminobenzene 5'-phosphate synthase
MKLIVLYDNNARTGFASGWGFSCLVKLENGNVLFDTGWDGDVLLSNMHLMGENPVDIRRIVLSHPHWDHIGGLNHLKMAESEVWVPNSFSKRLKEEMSTRFDLHEVGGPGEICDGVWTTGEIGGKMKEQSLILATSKGLIVVVGCSHPGVSKILDAASRFGRPRGIIGGMHGSEEYRALDDLDVIVPAHCTVHKREMLDRYPNKSMDGKVGMQLDIE